MYKQNNIIKFKFLILKVCVPQMGLNQLIFSCRFTRFTDCAAQVHELQDKLNSTLETFHQQRVLNHHLQLQLSATSQPSKDPEPGLTIKKILQQEKKVPGLFFHYTNLKYSTFVTLF